MTSRSELAEIERIAAAGGEADEVLRAVVAVLHRSAPYAAIAFVEDGELVIGPEAGSRTEIEAVPISFQGSQVAELRVAAAAADREALERVAELVAPYCLVGWDTGGEVWDP